MSTPEPHARIAPGSIAGAAPRRTAAEELRFDSTDGYPLAGTLFRPAEANGISVLISGAYATGRGYYAAYARYLAARGFTVLTYDYRGFGGSRFAGWRGEPPRQVHWGERDLAAAIEWLHGHAPDHRLVMVGHSAGGYLLGLAPNHRRVLALLTVATQSGYWRLRDGWRAALSYVFFRALLPAGARLAQRFPGLRRGPFAAPLGAALDWSRWGLHPQYFCDARGWPLRFHFDDVTVPVRAYHLADDLVYAPRRAVEALRDFYARAPVEIVHRAPADYGVERIDHFGFFRSWMPSVAWEETAQWLADAVGVRSAPATAAGGPNPSTGVTP